MSRRQARIAKAKKRSLDGLNQGPDVASDMQDCPELKHKTPSSLFASIPHVITNNDSPPILSTNSDNLTPCNECLDDSFLSHDAD